MLIWLVIAVLAAIGEVMTTGLFLACVAFAAVVVALLAIVVQAFALQVLAFAVLSLLGILLIRPLLMSVLDLDALSQHSGQVSQMHLNGKRAVVTRTVDGHSGQIRIGEGEFWSARAYDGDAVIPPGRTVEILLIDGVTALVSPIPPAGNIPAETSATSTKGES